MKLRLVCVFVGLVCLLVAAGCNSVEMSETVSSSGIVEEESDAMITKMAGSATQEPSGVEIAEPPDPRRDLRNDVLVLWSPQCGIADPAIDDASRTISVIGLRLVNEIHAGLMRIAEMDVATAEPALAAGFSVNEGGRVYEFVLREGLKFSDGSPLTAEDVKWSWERALILSTGISRANDVLGWIEGADAVATAASSDLTGVEVIDDLNLRVRLKSARSDFPMLLADPIAYVLRRENVEMWRREWDNKGSSEVYLDDPARSSIPVGAGPFKLVEYIAGSTAERCPLARNEHYWEGPARLSGVKLDRDLLMERMPESTNPFELEQRKFGDGEIDYVFSRLWREFDQRSETSDVAGKSVQVEDPIYTEFLIFNPSHPPFDDVHFRRALVAASDLDALYPSGAWWHRHLVPESVASMGEGVEGQGYDLSVADSELTASRYGDSAEDLEVTFIIPGDEHPVLSGLFDGWREHIGIEVTQWDSWSWWDKVDFDDAEPYDVLLDSGGLSMRFFSEPLQYPDPHAVLRFFISPFGVGHSSPELLEVEAMILDAAGEQDATERDRKYRDIETHILDQALALPLLLAANSHEIMTQPWVNGLRFPKYSGSVFYDVWLDDNAPERSLR